MNSCRYSPRYPKRALCVTLPLHGRVRWTGRARATHKFDRWRARCAVAKAPVDRPVDVVAGPAHHLGPRLLHLPAVRRPDGEGTRVVAPTRCSARCRRACWWPACARIPVGAWIDRGHGRVLMTGGSVLAAVLLFVWSRTHSLPVLYAVWIGLGACQSVTLYEPAFAVDHPCLWSALPAGDHDDDLRRWSRQHLRPFPLRSS